ncbi:MAG: invasion protein CiaB [Campylobacterota bacterium]
MQTFLQDLQRIYDKLESQDAKMQDWFGLLKDPMHPAKEKIERLLKIAQLEPTDDNKMAMLVRVINLRDDSLEQVLKKSGKDEAAIIEIKERIYNEVAAIHLQKHEELLAWIDTQKLLTPFYRTLINGVHSVGVAMSGWQSSWTAHIINGVNKELLELFEGDEGKVMDMLYQKNLLDKCGQEISDRCYSVLENQNGEYKKLAYAKAFEQEVGDVTQALGQMIQELQKHEDRVFDQKKQWLEYLQAIKEAFAHTDPDELVQYWSEVDRKWMAITTPLQIGHPLEYYEDHFRKAVALEWDLRIINPALQNDTTLQHRIKKMATTLCDTQVTQRNIAQIDSVQLYIGKPMLYYGAEFNGLFSAQVVPNDEEVSSTHGKKIFAFADFVLQSQRAKPTLKITQELFGKAYIQKKKAFLGQTQKWHQVYNITTIGHEYGHILWLDSDTESQMNKTAQFKNIEEFKATCGGLITFFENEHSELIEPIIDDTVSRAVGLMAWKEVGEVRPYYVEGLLHLHILFNSQVLRFEDKMLHIDYSNYTKMKQQYYEIYKELAQHYLNKKDAKEFLSRFLNLENGFIPKDASVKEFIDYHWTIYQEYGQEVIL